MFDWITNIVEQTGYLGIFLLMLAENIFPPIPSELIMPLAGFTAAQGKLNFFFVLLAGTCGSLVGALAWFWIGKWLGLERLENFAARHGRWLTLSPDGLGKADGWFKRNGGKAVFVGRLVPAVRTLISVPAGISEMPVGKFLAWSALGTVLWTALLAGVGYVLEGQYGRVAGYLNPVANAIVLVIAALYVYRVISFQPGSGKQSSGRDV